MSNQVMTRTRLTTVQWHYRPNDEQLTVATEARESRRLDDGTWLQITLPAGNRQQDIPHPFLQEVRTWRRFLSANCLVDAQLRYLRRDIRLPGPPPRQVRVAPEWSLFLTLPSLHPGSDVFTYACRTHRLPGKRLREYLQLLLQAPASLATVSQLPGPVMIEGDLLLGFVGSALAHLPMANEGVGRWLEESPMHRIGPGNHETLLPQTARFLPATFTTPPTNPWRAMAYADRQLLIVRRGEFQRVHLALPLYRLFPQLRFTRRITAATVRDVHYCMPQAVLFPT